ncbi:MAG: nucleotidyltransferase family protein, partial [Burkholderiales bacterium]|nr:nucleotidyltransferase family protein [Burkholderiales bacterium]
TIRPSRDLDVLVHRADMRRCIDALAPLGYACGETLPPAVMELYFDTYGQAILHAAERTPVEPHFIFAPRALAVDLDMDALWQRAAPVAFDGRLVPSLSLTDTLLAACLHGSKEKWWRLLWVADVAALVHRHTTVDWDALLGQARTSGVLRMLLLGLALAQDLFASKLPGEVQAAIARDRECARLVLRSCAHLFDSAHGVGSVNNLSRYHLRARERFADRARYVLRVLTTPGVNHYRMVTLPRPLTGGYVAIKLVHDYILRPAWHLAKRNSRRQEAALP